MFLQDVLEGITFCHYSLLLRLNEHKTLKIFKSKYVLNVTAQYLKHTKKSRRGQQGFSAHCLHVGTTHFSLMLIGFTSLHQRKNIGLKVTFSHAQISLFLWHFVHFPGVFLKLCFELNRSLLWSIMRHGLITLSRSV